MKLHKKSILAQSALVFTSVAALLTASCADMMKKPEPLTETKACDQLTRLIDDHPNKFNSYKKNKRVPGGAVGSGNFHTWTTTAPFPTAKNCQIYQWAGDVNSYICKWQSSVDGIAGAKADYTEGERIIKSCLSDQWMSDKITTTSGGEHTYFFKQNSATFVSIRYFKEQRSIMDNWYSVLYIGDKSNLKTKTQ